MKSRQICPTLTFGLSPKIVVILEGGGIQKRFINIDHKEMTSRAERRAPCDGRLPTRCVEQ